MLVSLVSQSVVSSLMDFMKEVGSCVSTTINFRNVHVNSTDTRLTCKLHHIKMSDSHFIRGWIVIEVSLKYPQSEVPNTGLYFGLL